MTNNQLRAEAKRLMAAVRTDNDNLLPQDITSFLKNLDKLIESEESAWVMLEELKASNNTPMDVLFESMNEALETTNDTKAVGEA